MTRLPVLLTVALAIAAPAFSQDATRKIHPVKGDVYLFQNNFQIGLSVKHSQNTVDGNRIQVVDQLPGEVVHTTWRALVWTLILIRLPVPARQRVHFLV